MTDFLYLVLHLVCKVTCYFRLFSSVLVLVLRTSINVLSKSKSRNYVTWIANLTKLFLSVYLIQLKITFLLCCRGFPSRNCSVLKIAFRPLCISIDLSAYLISLFFKISVIKHVAHCVQNCSDHNKRYAQ